MNDLDLPNGRAARAAALSRRTALGALVLPWLAAGCSTPLPLRDAPSAVDGASAARLLACAQAHGLDAYRRLTDINVGYSGEWRPLIDRIQPEVVDAGFRGSSQERLMPRAGIVAQAYTGPKGRKQVVWQRGAGAVKARSANDAPTASTAPTSASGTDLGQVTVWFNGVRSADAAALDAAALVAACYGLFPLGPLWLVERGLRTQSAGTERVDGQLCDVVDVWLRPGLGRVAADRAAVCIARSDGLMRRVRFTLEGFEGTRGAVAEVDTFDHERRFGMVWPMRSYERVVHPIPLPAHDWRITGLDVNRGYAAADIRGEKFVGAAAVEAARV